LRKLKIKSVIVFFTLSMIIFFYLSDNTTRTKKSKKMIVADDETAKEKRLLSYILNPAIFKNITRSRVNHSLNPLKTIIHPPVLDQNIFNIGWSTHTFALLMLSALTLTVFLGFIFGYIYFPNVKSVESKSQQKLNKLKSDYKFKYVPMSKNDVSNLI